MVSGLFVVPEMGKAEMADKDDANSNTLGEGMNFDLTDDEAQQLLNGDDEGEKQGQPKTETDSTDWKAEAERWKSFARKNEKQFKSTADELKQYKDKDKTELERLTERATNAEKLAATASSQANAMRIAMETAPEHATLAQVKAVAKRVRGDDDEALEKDAAELFEMLAPTPKTPKTPGKPTEKLKGGSEPDEEVEETDGRKIAAKIPRSTIL
jgi:hypothetical protein